LTFRDIYFAVLQQSRHSLDHGIPELQAVGEGISGS